MLPVLSSVQGITTFLMFLSRKELTTAAGTVLHIPPAFLLTITQLGRSALFTVILHSPTFPTQCTARLNRTKMCSLRRTTACRRHSMPAMWDSDFLIVVTPHQLLTVYWLIPWLTSFPTTSSRQSLTRTDQNGKRRMATSFTRIDALKCRTA